MLVKTKRKYEFTCKPVVVEKVLIQKFPSFPAQSASVTLCKTIYFAYCFAQPQYMTGRAVRIHTQASGVGIESGGVETCMCVLGSLDNIIHYRSSVYMYVDLIEVHYNSYSLGKNNVFRSVKRHRIQLRSVEPDAKHRHKTG